MTHEASLPSLDDLMKMAAWDYHNDEMDTGVVEEFTIVLNAELAKAWDIGFIAGREDALYDPEPALRNPYRNNW